jgi:hypothetical protein
MRTSFYLASIDVGMYNTEDFILLTVCNQNDPTKKTIAKLCHSSFPVDMPDEFVIDESCFIYHKSVVYDNSITSSSGTVTYGTNSFSVTGPGYQNLSLPSYTTHPKSVIDRDRFIMEVNGVGVQFERRFDYFESENVFSTYFELEKILKMIKTKNFKRELKWLILTDNNAI